MSFHEFDWPAAEREFLRGTQLNPNYFIGRYFYANYLVAMGRADEAIAEAEQAMQLDPVSPSSQSNLTSILWYARRYDRAIEQGHKVMEMSPDYSRAYEDLARAFEQTGAFDEAIETFQRGLVLDEAQAIQASLAFTYTRAGKPDEARRILRELEERAGTKFVSAYSFALIHAGLGQRDEAFAWLDKAYDERSSALPFLKANPRWDALRDDPRFVKLLKRLRLS
jgi:tetratricopeptide (TPR) repeat protein